MQIHVATIAPHEVMRKQRMNKNCETYDMTLGRRIQLLMKDRKLSARTVADACGITPGAVSNWFSTGRISKENLAVVCRLAHVDMAAFLGGDETPIGQAMPVGLDSYSPEALALAWLLDQVPNRLARVRAHHAATEAILREINQPDGPPTRMLVAPASQEKQRA